MTRLARPGGSPSDAAQRGRRAAGRRLPEDGVQGPQRRAVCLGRRAPAGPGRRRGARLPAQPGGPGPGLRADPVDRRGDARQRLVRAGVAARGHRASGPRGGLHAAGGRHDRGRPGRHRGAPWRRCWTRAWTASSSPEPIDEGVGLISVDVPVLVLGAPPTFAAPQVVTARVGAGLLARAATEHLLELGHATVHHLAGPQRWYSAAGPSRRLARGAASPRRERAASRRGRLVGRVRLRGGPGTGRRRHRDRGVRRE